MKKFCVIKTKISSDSSADVLEKIKKAINDQSGYTHVVSVNPENLVVASTDVEFNNVIETAQIQIFDGVGVTWALRFLYDRHFDRMTGTDLAIQLLEFAGEKRFRILLIGGMAKIAEQIAKCYSDKYPDGIYLGISGIDNIKNPTVDEEKKIFDIMAAYKPHIVLVSFGSPDQELWIDHNKARFSHSVCMGVGGAFDYIADSVPRAPVWVRRRGFEWLARLLIEPWRWKRQLRLIIFVYLVFLQKIRSY